jgi:TPP-dependent indolepyruvate ferredoxin oxidoreductase alpha subunit
LTGQATVPVQLTLPDWHLSAWTTNTPPPKAPSISPASRRWSACRCCSNPRPCGGLNTAGFISGYRGSPLGGLDEALWHAQPHLAAHRVKFQPGVNEDMAATAVWGTQQVKLIGPSDYDGVYAMWYGKGPGVDRCGDVLKHMNHAGTSAQGGVLLVAGDDHGAYSSTLPHQSDHIFRHR